MSFWHAQPMPILQLQLPDSESWGPWWQRGLLGCWQGYIGVMKWNTKCGPHFQHASPLKNKKLESGVCSWETLWIVLLMAAWHTRHLISFDRSCMKSNACKQTIILIGLSSNLCCRYVDTHTQTPTHTHTSTTIYFACAQQQHPWGNMLLEKVSKNLRLSHNCN